MTDTSHRDPTETGVPNREPMSGWAGWVVFAGVMLITLGAFQIVEGLVALFDDGFYAVTSGGLVVDVDYNTWGWIHLAIGVIGVLAGLGLLAGNMVARVVGVGIALVSALANLVFISAYPLWSVIMITIDVIVIFAIIVHGREVKSYR
ncbi:membrane protein [Geodermatophilus aquaeductus]|uniref:DUF7144 domain-containing protein n=1 Tax=Geodermatophilus aquaeductus TaxID=1564161 RepID=A0A521E5T6_9ACTN|nr:hypothetical protein [Geodermatophilus aquaeductus]SMO79267.1 hypothetical protein SAMN06273567_104269 [Geodermatophilus aquaeductus]